MPIISIIGSRSLKVRLVYVFIFLILISGAVTMVYPLMLMLCGSVKSKADFMEEAPWPSYWFDDLSLFQKYVESKYNEYLNEVLPVPDVQKTWQREISVYDKIEKPTGCNSG